MSHTLVIGYGNELCGDDGVGPTVARAISVWGRPDVQTLAVHQLTPELAQPISQARQVIFVDASVQSTGSTVRPLTPCLEDSALGHASNPGWLLALAEAVFEQAPPAWLIAVPVVDFEFGQPLSVTALAGVRSALDEIERLVVPGSSG